MGVSAEPQQASVMHVRCPLGVPEPLYRQVLDLLTGISPVVQAVPPGAALVELRGVLRYHGVGPRRLGEIARARAAARWGVELRIGIAPTISSAATASAQVGEAGGVLLVEPDRVQEWLGPLPVEALHGIGPRQAATLQAYGVHCVGLLATLPAATVQRLLGGRAGRLAAERARGVDPRPVTPRTLPASATVRRTFDHQVLDGMPVRAALLDLVVRLGVLLRQRGQVAQGLSLELAFAGGGTWSRTRRLADASAHEDDLRAVAYRLMDVAALERARLMGLVLRAEDLLDAGRVAEQATLDGAREARLRAEQVVDRARARFGPQVMVGPAALLGTAP
jgi:DNA polymerase-4